MNLSIALPEGATSTNIIRDGLPAVRFVRDNVRYEITDARYLSKDALLVLDRIIKQICDHPELNYLDCSEFSFDEPPKLSINFKWSIIKRKGNGITSSKGRILDLTRDCILSQGKLKNVFFSWSEYDTEMIHAYMRNRSERNYYDLVIAHHDWMTKWQNEHWAELAESLWPDE